MHTHIHTPMYTHMHTHLHTHMHTHICTHTHAHTHMHAHSCVKYVPEPEDSILLHTTIKTYLKFKQFPQALRLAMMLNDRDLIKKIFHECHNRCVV